MKWRCFSFHTKHDIWFFPLIFRDIRDKDRIGTTDTGKIPVILGYCSITFDEAEMVRIPVWCYQNDVKSIDV